MNFFHTKNGHHTIFGLAVSRAILNLSAGADTPQCKLQFRITFLENKITYRNTIHKEENQQGEENAKQDFEEVTLVDVSPEDKLERFEGRRVP